MVLIEERDEARSKIALAEAALEAADRMLAGVLSLEHTLRKFDSVHPVEMAAESYRGARLGLGTTLAIVLIALYAAMSSAQEMPEEPTTEEYLTQCYATVAAQEAQVAQR